MSDRAVPRIMEEVGARRRADGRLQIFRETQNPSILPGLRHHGCRAGADRRSRRGGRGRLAGRRHPRRRWGADRLRFRVAHGGGGLGGGGHRAGCAAHPEGLADPPADHRGLRARDGDDRVRARRDHRCRLRFRRRHQGRGSNWKAYLADEGLRRLAPPVRHVGLAVVFHGWELAACEAVEPEAPASAQGPASWEDSATTEAGPAYSSAARTRTTPAAIRAGTFRANRPPLRRRGRCGGIRINPPADRGRSRPSRTCPARHAPAPARCR